MKLYVQLYVQVSNFWNYCIETVYLVFHQLLGNGLSGSFVMSRPLQWKCVSDPILHIELRRWADLLVIAPLDANTLGKIASGICDNLLASIL